MNDEDIKRFFEEIGLVKGLKKVEKWIVQYKSILEEIRLQAKKEVLEDIDIKTQFACLESWCKSRGNTNADYCRNCRKLNEIKKRCIPTLPKEHNNGNV